MFGHSPPAVADAIRRQAGRGLTTMLPSPDAAIVGELLAKRFNLPFWQVTATASDANRSVIRWARAATGRRKLLVFNGLLSRRRRRHLRRAGKRQTAQPPRSRR